MIENPTRVKIEDRIYNINTSFKVALECNKIATAENISDYERPLAIIYKLYGEKGLNARKDWNRLLELAQKYLNLGKEPIDSKENIEADMDFEQDYNFIIASFMSDYQIDLTKEENMHWWTFYNLMNGLSNSEFGNCCILNKIRNLRTMDISDIKDSKIREKIIKAKEEFALNVKPVQHTAEELASIERFKNSLL